MSKPVPRRMRQRDCARERMGAVSSGSTLNAHVHFHCRVVDGVFLAGADGQVQFAGAAALRPVDLAAVQQQTRLDQDVGTDSRAASSRVSSLRMLRMSGLVA
jgi:hypothetical protein